jgi:hypothetical protein
VINRRAVIEGLELEGINVYDVANVRGVVIAGRSASIDIKKRIKLNENKNIEFYTYDDLLNNFVSIVRSFKKL